MAVSFGCGPNLKGRLVDEDLDGPYPLRDDVDRQLVSRFRPRARKRLSRTKWRNAFDSEGRLRRTKAVMESIRKGGVDPEIRPEVWEFLLGVHSSNTTKEERDHQRIQRREQYAQLLQDCIRADPIIGSGQVVEQARVSDDGTPLLHAAGGVGDGGGGGEGGGGGGVRGTRQNVLELPSFSERSWSKGEKLGRWRALLHQIGVDVLRTDRNLLFYETPANRARLMDTLAVYAWFDSEVGYCQGMSDLMSPMVVLFPNDADAFWAFEHLMRHVRLNFKGNSKAIGVQKEIADLSRIIQTVDPGLHKHMEAIGADTYFFTVRVIMELFRRELSFADSLYMWEMMWALNFGRMQRVGAAAPATASTVSTAPEAPSSNRQEDSSRESECGVATGQGSRNGQERGSLSSMSVSTFLVVALLEDKKLQKQLKRASALDEVVKDFNEAAKCINLKTLCKDAYKIQKRMSRRS